MTRPAREIGRAVKISAQVKGKGYGLWSCFGPFPFDLLMSYYGLFSCDLHILDL